MPPGPGGNSDEVISNRTSVSDQHRDPGKLGKHLTRAPLVLAELPERVRQIRGAHEHLQQPPAPLAATGHGPDDALPLHLAKLAGREMPHHEVQDRKSSRLNSSHVAI